MKYKIAAIVVTYHPDVVTLIELLDELNEQADLTIIVDNGSGEYLEQLIRSRSRANESLICLGENFGIATAHNIGIKKARQFSASHITFFDQDSTPNGNMILNLFNGFNEMNESGLKVAAVGPFYYDRRNINHHVFIRIAGLKIDKINCSDQKFIETDMIISSGSLIPMSILTEIGGPNNELFIDMVDVEWCLRAKSHGYSLYGICSAVMNHRLGDFSNPVLGHNFVHHSPLRHYYIFRNMVYLIFKKHIPLGWKLYFIRAICIRFIVYCCLISPRFAYFKMMSTGILHGIKGRLGRFKAI
jgi:rhamnosyltransferase